MPDPADERLDRLVAAVRAGGSRITPARHAVLRAMVDRHDHVTADDLAAAVRAEHPEVHLSTVYRALDAFERMGVVTHVHLGHGRAIYHLADQVHQHAVCESCGRVEQVPDTVLRDIAEHLRAGLGFEVDAHHFALVGRCSACTGEPVRR